MDYVYGFIAAAILFGVVLTLASWRRDYRRLNGIITTSRERSRCGHDWPELEKWDMSHTYREGVIPRL